MTRCAFNVRIHKEGATSHLKEKLIYLKKINERITQSVVMHYKPN
jgi:hypothetical protein